MHCRARALPPFASGLPCWRLAGSLAVSQCKSMMQSVALVGYTACMFALCMQYLVSIFQLSHR